MLFSAQNREFSGKIALGASIERLKEGTGKSAVSGIGRQ
jgi:hypothetical protein